MRKNWVWITFFLTLACFGLSNVFSRLAGPEPETAPTAGREPPFPVRILKSYLSKPTKLTDRHKAFTAAGVTELDLATVSTDLRIEVSTTPEITLDYQQDVDRDLVEEIAGSTIRIHERVEGRSSLLDSLDSGPPAEATLRIPATVKRLRLKTTSGDLHLNGPALERLDLETISGDVLITGAVADAEARTVSGELRFEQKNPAPQMRLSTVSGDVYLTHGRDLDANLDFSSASGEAFFTRPEGGQDHHDRNLDRKIGSGRGNIRIKTVSGDARIEVLSDLR